MSGRKVRGAWRNLKAAVKVTGAPGVGVPAGSPYNGYGLALSVALDLLGLHGGRGLLAQAQSLHPAGVLVAGRQLLGLRGPAQCLGQVGGGFGGHRQVVGGPADQPGIGAGG